MSRGDFHYDNFILKYMLQRFFIILTLILILPDIYIYRMFIIRMVSHARIKILYWLPTILFMAGIIFLAYFTDNQFISKHTQEIGWFAALLFFFALPKLIFTICSLIGLPFNYLLHWPKKPFIYTGLILGAISAGIVMYGTLVGKSRYEIKEITFHSPNLPEAFKGYRIVQISDLHIGSWIGDEADIQRLVDLINDQHPDLIVFTGDLVNSRTKELDNFEQILSGLRAKDGVYSILGNHDYGTYHKWDSKQAEEENLAELKKREKEMGWNLLNNEHVILHQGNDSIALIGVENEGEPPFSQHGNLPEAMQGTEGMFQILLSHNPTHWRREVLPGSDIELMLAGHTHAMQMAIGSVSPSSLVYPEWSGLYTEQERSLYVNVGIGFVGLPFRFGAWPEITVITLN